MNNQTIEIQFKGWLASVESVRTSVESVRMSVESCAEKENDMLEWKHMPARNVAHGLPGYMSREHTEASFSYVDDIILQEGLMFYCHHAAAQNATESAMVSECHAHHQLKLGGANEVNKQIHCSLTLLLAQLSTWD